MSHGLRSRFVDAGVGRHVSIVVFAVKGERVAEPFGELDTRLPSGGSLEFRRVGVKAADVDDFLLGRPIDVCHLPGAGNPHEKGGEVSVADWLIATDVERFAVAGLGRPGAEKRIGRIVDVHEIAQLRSVAEDLNRLVLECQADEPADESLAVMADQLSRSIDVGEAKGTGPDAEHVVVNEMVGTHQPPC